MKKPLFIFLTLLLFLNLHSQQWQWAKSFNLLGSYLTEDKLAIDNNSNSYLTGNIYTLGAVILKVDSVGNEIWRKYISGNLSITGICTKDNIVYVCGNFKGQFTVNNFTLNSSVSNDIFLLSLNGNGTILWIKTFGGSGYDAANDITIANNFIYLTGSYNGTLSANGYTVNGAGTKNMFYSKHDLSGNLTFLKSASASDSTSWSGGQKIRVYNDKIYILGIQNYKMMIDTFHIDSYYHGYYDSNFLCKLESLGKPEFLKQIGEGIEELTEIVVNPDESFSTCGWSAWHGSYPVAYAYNSMGKRQNFTYVAGTCYGDAGYFRSMINAGSDLFAFGDRAHGGNCIQPVSSHTLILAKYSPTLTRLYLDTIRSFGKITGSNISKCSNGDFIVSGQLINGWIKIGQDSIYTTGEGLFIAKFKDASIQSIKENKFKESIFDVYPNPSKGIFTIVYKANEQNPIIITLKNQLGQTILTNQYPEQKELKEIFDLSRLAKGVYFIQVNTDQATEIRKIITE
ncbi:MAG: T9SS type A sorting domain-containing protein [Bacteroidetes bacterium]|nr:T9SS type A sorting domain-containing protein [Bacteroidota bacterium]